MNKRREFDILHHLYGRPDGKLTCLRGARFHATGDHAGAWIGPGLVYYPADNDLVVSAEEAQELVARKLVDHGVAWNLIPTSPGRERYKALLREAAV